MRIEFNYTLDDVREAAMPAIFGGNRRLYRQHWAAIGSIAAACLLLIAISVAIPPKFSRPGLPEYITPEIVPTGIAFVVAIGVLAGRVASTKPATLSKDRRPAPWSRKLLNRLAGALPLLLLLGLTRVIERWSGPTWSPSPAQLFFLRVAPWAIVIFALVLSDSLARTTGYRSRWLSRPDWDLPRAAEIDESGYRAFSRDEQVCLGWACFRSARETPNLLILVRTDGSEIALPKRGFADATDVARCRALLRRFLPEVRFLPQSGGFAVLPVTSLAE